MRPRWTTALPSIVLLCACSENQLVPFPNSPETRPDIAVHPTALDFEIAGPGEEVRRTFTVENIGTAEVTVTDLAIEGDGFSLPADTEFTLASGAEREVQVAFEPTSAEGRWGAVTVFSTDPDDGAIEVDLTGRGGAPDLVVDPPFVDFGTLEVGCAAEQTVRMSNVGTWDLVVEGIEPGGDAAVLAHDALPIVLAPGASSELRIGFAPAVAGAARGELAFVSNDADGDEFADWRGAATERPWHEDVFVLPANPPVDVLFAVDQSRSMDRHAANLAANFGTFIDTLSSITADWRIGVVTLDEGCLNGGVLTADTPTVSSVFGAAVADASGPTALTEQLFTLTGNALANTTSCNAGFLRPEAALHVVFVSDEWEQSGPRATAAERAAAWVTDASAFASSFRASGIICPEAGCPWSDDGQADGYREAIALTGGVRLDIAATDWGSAAVALAQASAPPDAEFPLSEVPDPSTINVRVDGAPAAWTYDAGALVVDAAPGATVVVRYRVPQVCAP